MKTGVTGLKNNVIEVSAVTKRYAEVHAVDGVDQSVQEGEIFGQFSLERNNLNGEFARAYKGDVSLCAFSIEDFEKLLTKKPMLAIKYSKQVGEKLRRAEFRLVNMLNKDVRSRLLALSKYCSLIEIFNFKYFSPTLGCAGKKFWCINLNEFVFV